MRETLLKNRTRLIVIAVLIFLFLSASQGMEPNDWVITVLRGLAVGAIGTTLARARRRLAEAYRAKEQADVARR